MVKTSTVPPNVAVEIVRLRLEEHMGPSAIVAYGKSQGWKTTRGKQIKKHHVDTILYPRDQSGDGPAANPQAADSGRSGGALQTHPSPGQETVESDVPAGAGVELLPPGSVELLAVEERRALPGYTDDEGRPIRPQMARLELFKASRFCYQLALKDYKAARAGGWDRCSECGTTREGLLRRVQQGLRMADGLLVSAEGSEERAARVQITQLNFNMGGRGDDPANPEAPEPSSEPVLNVDLVRLLGLFLGEHDLSIEVFFTYVQEERVQA